jgi:hypothetical protein
MTEGYGGQDVFFDAAEGGDATRSGPVWWLSANLRRRLIQIINPAR